LHQADGTVAALSNLRTGTLEITVPVAAADPDPKVSPWSGMSGAAVWAGCHIVGVVAEHHRWEGLGRLTAARIDHALRGVGEPHRGELAELLAINDPQTLPDVGPAPDSPDSVPLKAGSTVIGLPVTHGLELFKDRTEVRELIGRHLSNPAIRMVTITGRRGMGKSAVAAKVMETLEQGEWPGHVQAPVPSGLVNLSTRTSGVSLERLYLDCARLLGSERETRLLDVWATNRPVMDKIGELFAAMGDRLFIILMDNLEDRLQDDGRLDDDELAIFLDCLFRARSTPRLLVTSQIPLRLPPELRRFAAEVELSDGLPLAESVLLLRELDHGGSLGVAQLSDEQLLQAAVHVHGVPRALELLVGAMADDTLTLPTLQDVLEDFALRGDVVAGLAQDRYQRVGAEGRTVLNVLAVLRTPVPREAIEWIVAGLDPGLDVTRVLDAHAVRGPDQPYLRAAPDGRRSGVRRHAPGRHARTPVRGASGGRVVREYRPAPLRLAQPGRHTAVPARIRAPCARRGHGQCRTGPGSDQRMDDLAGLGAGGDLDAYDAGGTVDRRPGAPCSSHRLRARKAERRPDGTRGRAVRGGGRTGRAPR
jgi:hypothetical protein